MAADAPADEAPDMDWPQMARVAELAAQMMRSTARLAGVARAAQGARTGLYAEHMWRTVRGYQRSVRGMASELADAIEQVRGTGPVERPVDAT